MKWVGPGGETWLLTFQEWYGARAFNFVVVHLNGALVDVVRLYCSILSISPSEKASPLLLPGLGFLEFGILADRLFSLEVFGRAIPAATRKRLFQVFLQAIESHFACSTTTAELIRAVPKIYTTNRRVESWTDFLTPRMAGSENLARMAVSQGVNLKKVVQMPREV